MPRSAAKPVLQGMLVAILTLMICVAVAREPVDPVSLSSPPFPEWVYRHWVWENEGNQISAENLVSDYVDTQDIPVGALIIDRPWQTAPMTFNPQPQRYDRLPELIEAMHAREIRVLMWAVSIVNEEAERRDGRHVFGEGDVRGYFLNGGKTVSWWGGQGAFLDYTNGEAVAWWHDLMAGVLEWGIDGWKCDGSDPLIALLGVPQGQAGTITWNQYRDAYYRDFFDFTRQFLGADRVIMARSTDSVVGLPFALPFAPRDVNFAGWVGDQDGDFSGLEAALRNMVASSALGYVNFGSDIGGFRGEGLRDPELFVRWAQLGALSPIMENGGGGEHRPWKYDEAYPDLGYSVADIYRTFTVLHHELIPYLYSQGAKAWIDGESLMQFLPLTEYQYQLGESLLVAPFVEPGDRREVYFPAGNWRDWLNEDLAYSGPATHTVERPLDGYPVFVREGSIVPLDVQDDTTQHGDRHSQGYLTVAVYPQNAHQAQFDLYEQDGEGVRFGYRYVGDDLLLEASPTQRPLLWRVRGGPAPAAVESDFGGPIHAAASPHGLGQSEDRLRAWATDDQGVTWIRITDPDPEGVRLHLRP